MLAFFHICEATGSGWQVDSRYWAEKVQPHGERDLQAYAEDRVRALLSSKPRRRQRRPTWG
ncbi:hypothetical protein EDD90_10324 [Streptomyces sp. Ag109_O5-1]|nr:hypothetical protein EDD90_10324 [Streptomyces sp. Ag109_O5-1]